MGILNVLRRILGPLVDMIAAIVRSVKTPGPPQMSVQPTLPLPPEPLPINDGVTTTQAEPPQQAVVQPPAVTVTKDPNRRGTFIITDIYPKDLGPNPPYHMLPGKVTAGKEMIGAIVKASQGTSWGVSNEDWFRRSWKKIKDVGGDSYGVDWFRGAYHFLVFQKDGAAQADYFLDLVEKAGGWDIGDIMPIVDAEEGGQGTWAGGEKLESIKDPAKRKRLADEVVTCVSKFADRVRHRTGLRVMLYGRGIMRDLQINDRMHCDAVMNPAYTKTMPPMDKYGWPIADVPMWQLCGDGDVYCPGFPSEIPGWGKEDYSVYIDGNNKTDLISFRRRVLARPR